MKIGAIRKLSCAFLVLLLMVASTAVIGAAPATTAVAPEELAAVPAQEFSLPAINGQTVTVSYAGKLTVLNFWAVRCSYCREEMPEINNFASAYRARLQFYAIDLKEPADKVTGYLQENKFSLPVLLDGSGELGKQFAVKTIPTTIVIDSQGNIVFRKAGVMTQAELEGVVAGHL
ncbi:MAG TPA: TlpA disulfide reductase family protein [Patescibacteria group bacterium]|nr:TlpA disulfide reductase family protein [Patescibacteria group bacterium]